MRAWKGPHEEGLREVRHPVTSELLVRVNDSTGRVQVRSTRRRVWIWVDLGRLLDKEAEAG